MLHTQDRGSSLKHGRNKYCMTCVGQTARTVKQLSNIEYRKHRLYYCCAWREERNNMSDLVRFYEMKVRTSKEYWTWSGTHVVPETLQMRDNQQHWLSETSLEWDRKVEGFREHIAIDGSSNGVSGRDAACGCAVVQLFYEKEEHRGMQSMVRCWRSWTCRERSKERSYGLSPWLGLIGPTTVHADNMGIIDGLWVGEEGFIGLK